MLWIKYQRIPGMRKRTCRVYKSWAGMMHRCYVDSCKDFKWYGGRGIAVCADWHDFKMFYDDMAQSFKVGLTIDRIDVNEGYAPHNCRWIDRHEQCRNRRSTNFLTNPMTGETKTLTDWAVFYDMSRNTITSRLRLGYKDFFTLIAPKHAMRNGNLKHHFAEEARNVAD